MFFRKKKFVALDSPQKSEEIVYDDSEDSLGISSSDSEEEDQDITYAQFKKRDYAKIS